MATKRITVRVLGRDCRRRPPAERGGPERHPASVIAAAVGVSVSDLPDMRLTADVGEDHSLYDWQLTWPPDEARPGDRRRRRVFDDGRYLDAQGARARVSRATRAERRRPCLARLAPLASEAGQRAAEPNFRGYGGTPPHGPRCRAGGVAGGHQPRARPPDKPPWNTTIRSIPTGSPPSTPLRAPQHNHFGQDLLHGRPRQRVGRTRRSLRPELETTGGPAGSNRRLAPTLL